ncbi:MAG: 16S rRNA (uracil(1498)-N(3))-methyltransferase [Pseudomonadales bacterium]
MNTLLLEDGDFSSSTSAIIRGQRADHLIETVGVKPGSVIRCGKVDGLMGEAVIREQSASELSMDCSLQHKPPAASHIELICALPRPKMLRRIVRTAAELGIKQLILINSFRVEKSYWQSPLLTPPKLREFCIEGLQQAGDTVLPNIILEKRFKPFVEDQLPSMIEGKQTIVAHPRAPALPASKPRQACMLAVGPEGGFIDFEIEKLQSTGFSAHSFGQRVLRCDTAIPFLIATLGS